MVFSFETINGNLLPNNVKKVIYHKWYEWELSILHHGKYGFTMNGMNGKCLYHIMVNMALPWMVWMGTMVLPWMIWMGNAYITSW